MLVFLVMVCNDRRLLCKNINFKKSSLAFRCQHFLSSHQCYNCGVFDRWKQVLIFSSFNCCGSHWRALVGKWLIPPALELLFWPFLNFLRFLYDCACLRVCSLYLGDGYSSAPGACVVDPLELREGAWYKMLNVLLLPPPEEALPVVWDPPSTGQQPLPQLLDNMVMSFGITGVPVLCTQPCLFLLGVKVERLWEITRAHCAQFCQFVHQPKGWEVSQVFIQGKESLLRSVGYHTVK